MATTYEYVAVAGEKASSVVCKFTTEKAAQLPNAGFEKRHGSKPTYVYESGGTMFWDTGNHGSQKAGTDITTADGSVKHGGSYQQTGIQIRQHVRHRAVCGRQCIFRQIPIATNMDGVVGNGVLGWGRPFESVLQHCAGYVRYQSNTVNYDNSCEFIDKGDPDIGSIFIVLGQLARRNIQRRDMACNSQNQL